MRLLRTTRRSLEIVVVVAEIAGQDWPTRDALLTLNNSHATETSFLTPAKWQSLIDGGFVATCIKGSAALLIAFDNEAEYDNPNFRWFSERLSRFVYVDRVIVDAGRRGESLAKQLYLDLFRRMREAGHETVVCEVNLVPPNPGSDAFHLKMGFTEMGVARLPGSDKTVRYLVRYTS